MLLSLNVRPYQLSSGGRPVVGVSVLGPVVRAFSIVPCAAGRCCRPASIHLSTIHCVCHTIFTNQPIGRSAMARAADPSGRCPSGRRWYSRHSAMFLSTLRARILVPSSSLMSWNMILLWSKQQKHQAMFNNIFSWVQIVETLMQTAEKENCLLNF